MQPMLLLQRARGCCCSSYLARGRRRKTSSSSSSSSSGKILSSLCTCSPSIYMIRLITHLYSSVSTSFFSVKSGTRSSASPLLSPQVTHIFSEQQHQQQHQHQHQQQHQQQQHLLRLHAYELQQHQYELQQHEYHLQLQQQHQHKKQHYQLLWSDRPQYLESQKYREHLLQRKQQQQQVEEEEEARWGEVSARPYQQQLANRTETEKKKQQQQQQQQQEQLEKAEYERDKYRAFYTLQNPRQQQQKQQQQQQRQPSKWQWYRLQHCSKQVTQQQEQQQQQQEQQQQQQEQQQQQQEQQQQQQQQQEQQQQCQQKQQQQEQEEQEQGLQHQRKQQQHQQQQLQQQQKQQQQQQQKQQQQQQQKQQQQQQKQKQKQHEYEQEQQEQQQERYGRQQHEGDKRETLIVCERGGGNMNQEQYNSGKEVSLRGLGSCIPSCCYKGNAQSISCMTLSTTQWQKQRQHHSRRSVAITSAPCLATSSQLPHTITNSPLVIPPARESLATTASTAATTASTAATAATTASTAATAATTASTATAAASSSSSSAGKEDDPGKVVLSRERHGTPHPRHHHHHHNPHHQHSTTTITTTSISTTITSIAKLDQLLMAEITEFSMRPCRPLTLNEIATIKRDAFTAISSSSEDANEVLIGKPGEHRKQVGRSVEQYLSVELPVRFASRIKQIEAVPLFSQEKLVMQVRQLYVESFKQLRMCDWRDKEAFTTLLKNLKKRHAPIAPLLVEGLRKLKHKWPQIFTSRFVDDFLDTFFLSRIERKEVWMHHLYARGFWRPACVESCLFSASTGTEMLTSAYLSPKGIVDMECDPMQVIKRAALDAERLCHYHYGCCPRVLIWNNEKERFACVPQYLYYILFELFKNAMRATVERSRKQKSLSQRREFDYFGSEEVAALFSGRDSFSDYFSGMNGGRLREAGGGAYREREILRATRAKEGGGGGALLSTAYERADAVMMGGGAGRCQDEIESRGKVAGEAKQRLEREERDQRESEEKGKEKEQEKEKDKENEEEKNRERSLPRKARDDERDKSNGAGQGGQIKAGEYFYDGIILSHASPPHYETRSEESDSTLPPIQIVVSGDDQVIAIKMADQGGGISQHHIDKIWSYMYTTAHPVEVLSDDVEEGGGSQRRRRKKRKKKKMKMKMMMETQKNEQYPFPASSDANAVLSYPAASTSSAPDTAAASATTTNTATATSSGASTTSSSSIADRTLSRFVAVAAAAASAGGTTTPSSGSGSGSGSRGGNGGVAATGGTTSSSSSSSSIVAGGRSQHGVVTPEQSLAPRSSPVADALFSDFSPNVRGKSEDADEAEKKNYYYYHYGNGGDNVEHDDDESDDDESDDDGDDEEEEDDDKVTPVVGSLDTTVLPLPFRRRRSSSMSRGGRSSSRRSTRHSSGDAYVSYGGGGDDDDDSVDSHKEGSNRFLPFSMGAQQRPPPPPADAPPPRRDRTAGGREGRRGPEKQEQEENEDEEVEGEAPARREKQRGGLQRPKKEDGDGGSHPSLDETTETQLEGHRYADSRRRKSAGLSASHALATAPTGASFPPPPTIPAAFSAPSRGATADAADAAATTDAAGAAGGGESAATAQPSPLAGFGCGLPLSRLYAAYLGGRLDILSLPFHGSDAYLYLNRIGDKQVETGHRQ